MTHRGGEKILLFKWLKPRWAWIWSFHFCRCTFCLCCLFFLLTVVVYMCVTSVPHKGLCYIFIEQKTWYWKGTRASYISHRQVFLFNSSSYPVSYFEDQASLELRNRPACDFQGLGLKACATTNRLQKYPWDKVSLCSIDWPGTCHVSQSEFELKETCLPLHHTPTSGWEWRCVPPPLAFIEEFSRVLQGKSVLLLLYWPPNQPV